MVVPSCLEQRGHAGGGGGGGGWGERCVRLGRKSKNKSKKYNRK